MASAGLVNSPPVTSLSGGHSFTGIGNLNKNTAVASNNTAVASNNTAVANNNTATVKAGTTRTKPIIRSEF